MARFEAKLLLLSIVLVAGAALHAGPLVAWQFLTGQAACLVAWSAAGAVVGPVGVYCRLYGQTIAAAVVVLAATFGLLYAMVFAPLWARASFAWFAPPSLGADLVPDLVPAFLALALVQVVAHVLGRVTADESTQEVRAPAACLLFAVLVAWTGLAAAPSHARAVQETLVAGARPGSLPAHFYAGLAFCIAAALVILFKRSTLRSGLAGKGTPAATRLVLGITGLAATGSVAVAGLAATLMWIVLLPYAASLGGSALRAAFLRSVILGAFLALVGGVVAAALAWPFGATEAALAVALVAAIRAGHRRVP